MIRRLLTAKVRGAPRLALVLAGGFAVVVLVGFVFPPWSRADPVSDEFSNPSTLTGWKVRDAVEGGAKTYERLDIGKTRKGWLTIVPRPGNGWYQDGMGPMLYRELEGDFLVETRVVTYSRRDPDKPPQAKYNSAGLIVRDPGSKRGSQNWVVVNTGNQNTFTGSEAKNTVNSRSQLHLQRGSHNGQLRLARIGSMIYTLRKLDKEQEWTLIREFNRTDLPKNVQVGLMCNGWDKNADLIAAFDYVRFSVPKSKAALRRD